ncbi:MAG: hypothetical protein WCQ95_04770 [Bacteroidota bacterium]
MIKFFTLPRLANLFIFFAVVIVLLRYTSWKDKDGIINNDVLEYYSYLPATFIYHDVSLKFAENYLGPHKFAFWPRISPTGHYILKMSMGMSYMYFPFFCVGHVYALCFGYDAGGFSMPYQVALLIGALFYLMLGLYYLRKILQRYFTPFVTAFVLSLIVFATNLFYYSSFLGPMSHVFTFALFSMFIYYSIQWHENPRWTQSLITGLLMGALVIIRPTNILMILFFIFYNIKSFRDIKPRMLLFLKNYSSILIICICLIAYWIPQIIYWKNMTGQWFYYSYLDEHFNFQHPRFLLGLFGYRKGWLLYTPLMGFSLIGFLLSFKKLPSFFVPAFLFLTLNFWIVFSWWCWWYGGSYGLRALIDIYALLAMGLGVFITAVWKLKPWFKYPLILMVLACVLLNMFNIIQFQRGALHIDSMTKNAYWKNFGHMDPYGNYYHLIRHPDYDKAKRFIDDTLSDKK